jgi:hypothetical protein
VLEAEKLITKTAFFFNLIIFFISFEKTDEKNA